MLFSPLLDILLLWMKELLHVIALVPRLKIYPKVDFLSSIELAQSESVYPLNLGSLLLLYKMPKSSVPFTYLSTLFVVV